MARNLVTASPTLASVPTVEEAVAANAILEFQSPTLALVAAPAPLSARMTTWLITSLVLAMIAIFATVKIDRLVSTTGVILAESPNVIVQPLETAIVRKIYVKEGQVVKKGELLAELDPTFAASDETATAAQMASLKAQVDRMRAELANKPYVSDGTQYGQLEELAYLQRHQQFTFQLEDYDQKIKSLAAKVAQADADVGSLTKQLVLLQKTEDMRRQLERMQVGSRLNTTQAELDRESGQQKLDDARHALEGAKRDLASMVAERDSWKHQWYADTQNLESQQERLLSDMQGQTSKNELRRKLIEMRANTDSVVLSVSRVAPGTVLQSGVELMTTVPVDDPLEVVAMVDGSNAGFVKPGDEAAIKFDTLPYFRYGYALGHVTRVSADSFTDPTQGQVNPQATSPNIASNSPQNNGTAPLYYYRAFVSIDKLNLRHPPDSFRLKPGMPLQVDIRVGRRTVLDYMFDKIVPFLANGAKEPT
ncbi:MAG: HlyD family type I secretion periplasmic adaptor subunit [Alphaproteobacteria bacterium]|nr:HlyD family type I secretion periplasmic adaptor subunit [Alphaproteobacteria bacterium]